MAKQVKIVPTRKTKHILYRFLITILVIILVPMFPLTVYYFNHEYADIPTYNWSNTDTFNLNDYPSIVDSDNTFKILQLSDLHLTFGGWPGDAQTFRLIDSLIDEVEPDLVIFTGDNAFTVFNSRMYEQLIIQMNQHTELKWTFIFGNHDDFGRATKEALAKIAVENSTNILFQYGPTNLGEGVRIGNFPIIVKDSLGNVKNALILMDSTASGGVLNTDISNEQVEWYEWIVQGINTNGYVPSILFFHVPLQEFTEIEQSNIISGTLGNVHPQVNNSGLYSKAVELGSTIGIFVGHNHSTDFTAFSSDNILLSFGRVTGYLAGTINNFLRSGRVIELDLTTVMTALTLAANTFIVE